MSNKLFSRIILTAIFGTTAAYMYKSWKANDDKTEFNMNDIELKQTELDIKEIKAKFKNSIWSVKSESGPINFQIVFRNEGERSFGDKPFILDLLTSAMTEGAGSRDAFELKKAFEDNSIGLTVVANGDDIVVTGSCLLRSFDLCIDLLCDVMTKSHFKENTIDEKKQVLLVSLQQMLCSPRSLAKEKLNNLAMPKPYHYMLKQGLEDVKKYTSDDVKKVYKNIFDPRNAEITIVSNIDEQKIVDSFNKVYDALYGVKSNNFKPGQHRSYIDNAGKTVHIEIDNPQSTILFAMPGVELNSRDAFAIAAANDTFGSLPLVCRISKVVRDKNGLVYGIRTSFMWGNGSGGDLQSIITGSADTRPENVAKVIALVKEEIKKLADKGITQEELDRFKICKFAQTVFDTNGTTLAFVSSLRTVGIKSEGVNTYLRDSYQSLTLDEVNIAIKKVYDPDKILFVTCGKTINTEEKKDVK
ncbi:MAG: insulinase family protein [Alphaproteobacteria bacterium]|nr:insulinase family protein [Alphaproteobacteria bacterium]